ncbi:MAG: cytochrome b N-terminal domain-containing protein [Chloroflexota bacterium]|nr:cytochrome b N-terminal domain-containing protein [Chloroflexota bacterium]
MLHKRGNFLYHIHPARLPASAVRFAYTLGLGGIAFWLFLILAVTGALELFYYIPTAAEANDSVKTIAYLANYGWLVRNMHYWAAQGMVVAAFLHLCRVFFTGAAKGPRRFNWLLGVVLFLLTLFMDFSGYVLRWDQATQWALLVGTNLVKEIPLAGGSFYSLLVGGRELSGATLLRFYGWHIVALPLLAFAIMVWHFWRIRRDGGISHPAPAAGQTSLLASRDDLLFRELVAAVVVTCLLVLLAAVATVPIGPAADLTAISPVEVRAPWIFVGVQVLLRYAPPVVAGIIAPALFVLFLAALPFVERGAEGTGVWFAPQRRGWLLAFGLVVAVGVALVVWGFVFL